MGSPKAAGDRGRRLREALPKVGDAVRLERVFLQEHAKIWNDLRRGLSDVKKEPAQLEQLQLPCLSSISDTWEFIMTMMETSMKFARQVMDAVATLLSSPRWAAGFAHTRRKGRLAFWKLSTGVAVGPSPVELTLSLLQLGGQVDEMLPCAEDVVANASVFVHELFLRASDFGTDVSGRLEDSELASLWRLAKDELLTGKPLRAASAPCVGGSESGDAADSFGSLSKANRAEAASIEASGTRDRRGGCCKEEVDSLIDLTAEVLDCAAKCLEPMLSGYAGEQNIALSARSRVLELMQRQESLQAQLVILGPCQVGKTSLTYSLVGFAALPPATPSMVTTRWVHTPNLAVPKLTIPEALEQTLQAWCTRIRRFEDSQDGRTREPVPLCKTVEGMDAVAEALDRIHRTVHHGRHLGVVRRSELEVLSRPAMSVSVEVAFAALANLEERLADAGTLSVADLPSPDADLWEKQDILNLHRRWLREADGVLVVVDASKHEAPRWLADLLRAAFLEERVLRQADAWIIANRIDQLAEFFCEDGHAGVCRRVKDQQYQNYRDVIAGEDHVIPTAARLSLLGLYGQRQVTSQLNQATLAELSRQPWFAQVCSFLFGVHWVGKVRMMEPAKWRHSMSELKLLGQVTGTLANSVLETAYLKMLPRSVARVMFDLSQLIAQFLASLRALQGGAAAIDAARLKLVFANYFEDAKRRVLSCLRQKAPTEADVRHLAGLHCDKPVVLDDPDSGELNEKYFAALARTATNAWQSCFEAAVAACCEEASRAHKKWQRSIDHYLTQGGVDAAMKQRVLVDSKNLDLGTCLDSEAQGPLGAAARDQLALQHAAKVAMTASKQLFQRTRKAYAISPESVRGFLLELSRAWILAAEAEIVRRCVVPIQKNFEDMVQNVEELNAQCLAGARRPASFDFSFTRQVETVLQEVAAFDAREDALGASRCEELCEKGRAAICGLEGPAASSAPDTPPAASSPAPGLVRRMSDWLTGGLTPAVGAAAAFDGAASRAALEVSRSGAAEDAADGADEAASPPA